ncbi:hypothetical protein JXJ21_17345 [candidate division KSB1 bacterium]|nr:hypothetical protein [candidate division KSB1 bacterium]
MRSILFAGLDVSTQSCKLLVIDSDQGEVVFTDTVNYDSDLPQYKTYNGVIQGLGEGVSESDPQMWIDALMLLFDRLAQSSVRQELIRAISVSGQQHGLVALDTAGNLTRARSKLWNDFSTGEECDLLTREVGGPDRMIEEVGNSQRTGYTAAKIFHFARHEPQAFERTATLFLVHNFINWVLTGGKNGGIRVMEPGDTSGMALWNPKTRQWSHPVLNAISPDLMQKLPAVKPSDEFIGTISGALAEKYGFSPECRIDAGSGDNMYGAVGTGNVEPGIVTISLGSSGTAYTFMEHEFIDPSGEIAAFCDSTGNHLPLLCVSNLANGYNDILKEFSINHTQFNEIIRKTEPGNAGRVLIPWYMGERTPDVPLASPTYFGFGIGDFTIENLCRAVLEGHVLNLYDGFRKMPVKAREIRLTGGLSQSPAWCQIIADVFEAETVPVEGAGAALGAALHAAWVYAKMKTPGASLKELVKPFVILNESRRKKPEPQNLKIYRLQKELFQNLSLRVRGVHSQADPFEIRKRLLDAATG